MLRMQQSGPFCWIDEKGARSGKLSRSEKDLNNESQSDQEDICFVDLKEEVREEF